MIRHYKKYWLFCLGLGLVVLHLVTSHHFASSDFFNRFFLFWMVALLSWWQIQDKLRLESDPISSFIGTTIISLVLYKSLHLFDGDFFLRIAPFLMFLGWILLASGIRGFKQCYSQLFCYRFWQFLGN